MKIKFTPAVAGLMASTFMVAPAFAQAAEEANDEDVIIVTATKRAQDVQDVPLAVTAVSPQQLEAQGVVNVQEITQVSPSFSTSQAQNSSGTVVLRIRGVGTTSNNIGFESAVGVFIDGAYQSRAGVALSEFVDVERVEVLRGPQGTLFGRNTSAGALSITNKRPELGELGGFINATYGNYNHKNLQGAVNVPLSGDTVAMRLTGAWRDRDGFIDLVDENGAKIGEGNTADQWLIRGQIGWETDSGFTGNLKVDYNKSTGVCCSAVEVLQSGLEGAGAYAAVGLGLRGGQAGPVATDPNDTAGAQEAVDSQIAAVSRPHTANTTNWGVTGEIGYPLSDDVDLVYIGSYRDYDSTESYDSDFTALEIFNVDGSGSTSIKTMTHELRVQGQAGALDWMIGGFYSDEEIRSDGSASLGADYDANVGALFGGAFGPAPLGLFNGGVAATGAFANNLYSQDSKSWSIFTHNTLEITDGLDLTVGLRWSDEKKDGSFEQLQVSNAVCPATLGGIGAGAVPPTLLNTVFVVGCFPFTAPAIGSDANPLPLTRPFSVDFNDDELIYTGKLAYDFGDVNAYVSYTHGYKAGGINLDVTAATGGADPRFASEEVDAYEFGLKGRFMDGAITANLALFHQEFENFQVLEFTGVQFETFNVPKALSKGFELESQIRASDELTINAALTYVEADYPGDCAATTDALRVQNLCGSSLTNAPDLVTILGATYRDDLTDDLTWFINGQIRSESDRRTSTQPSTPPTTQAALGTTPLLPFDVQDGTVKINLRAGIGKIDESWGVEAWATNITNQITRGVTFNTLLRTGSRSAFTQQPRMYGVTLRGKF